MCEHYITCISNDKDSRNYLGNIVRLSLVLMHVLVNFHSCALTCHMYDVTLYCCEENFP